MKEMKELINKLNQYSYEYYTLGKPTVTDATYDTLYDKLVKLEKETGVILSNSPTQKVGGEVLSNLTKITHKYPMLSLDKCHSAEEVLQFANGKDIVALFKLDGLTTDIVEDEFGQLKSGATRGNGTIGELITHNVKTYKNVPLKSKATGKEVHIIGESIMDYNTFNKINYELPPDVEKFKHPRNLCSGSVRQLDSSICKKRNIQFYGYIVEGIDFKYKMEQLDFIKELGFDVCEHRLITKDNLNKEYIENIFDEFKEIAKQKSIPIDGVVFMYNDIEYGKSLGRTVKFPKHSIAYKYEDDLQETTISNIRWQIGRTGVITPVADFETVEIDGTDVSKATLNNISILKELNLNIGSRVTVKKANMIIPQIVDNITKDTDILIDIPSKVEGHDTEIRQSSTKDGIKEFLYLKDNNNNIVLTKSISHYCNRDAMNIVGLSEKSIEKFIEKGFIKSILDIYSLDKYKKEIIHMEGFGLKSYNKLIDSIEKSKQCKLENFIYALGIPNVGLQTAKDICKYFNNDIDRIIVSDKTEYMRISGIGESVADSIVNYFIKTKNVNFINSLINQLSFIKDNPKENNNISLEGKTFVITGKVHIYKNRNEIKDIIESLGGKVSGSVSSKTDYLINNDINSNSGKNKTAKELNIPIISEEQFVELIK